MANKYVMGQYPNSTEAERTVQSLIEEGYPRDSISLVGNRDALSGISDTSITVDSDYYDDTDDSLWERIKHFFGADDEHEDRDTLLASYRSDLENGNVLVLIDEDNVPVELRRNLLDRNTSYTDTNTGNMDMNTPAAYTRQDNTAGAYNAADWNDDETIRLEAERMNVDKEEVQAGEVVVKKRVVEENQTINVPVRHEEVVIERQPVHDQSAASASFEDETFTIPLHEEQINVTKHPVVTEEVRIHKNDVSADQQVSASLRKEELDVDKTGNVVIRDNQPPADRV